MNQPERQSGRARTITLQNEKSQSIEHDVRSGRAHTIYALYRTSDYRKQITRFFGFEFHDQIVIASNDVGIGDFLHVID